MIYWSNPTFLLFSKILIALGLGVLIGLEREQSQSAGSFAGIRTFSLFALYGAIVQAFFPQAFQVALASLILPLSIAYASKIVLKEDIGLTTLLASLLIFMLGALATYSNQGTIMAIVLGGIITVLLSTKTMIHKFAQRVTKEEKYAMAKFVVVILIILPLLPNKELEFFFDINPQFIWLMVVFVSSLSFIAYILSKALGAEKGLIVTGVLGGFISSTATAVSMAGRTKDLPNLYKISGFSTIIASIVMFPRALLEVFVVNPSLINYLWLPLGLMTLVGIGISSFIYFYMSFEEIVKPEMKNPFSIKTALFFGFILVIVIIGSELANNFFGDTGIYLSAFISGLADVDAITLTLSKISADGIIEAKVASIGIVIAAISNTLVKAFLTLILGTYKLGRLVILILGLTSIIGILSVLLI